MTKPAAGAKALPSSKRAGSHAQSDDARWTAVLQRDASSDGVFVYGVKTTGVYCRPSSGARLPKRENVVFFDSAEAAEAAGFRASRRAAGDQSLVAEKHAAVIAQACRMIESADAAPRLETLAAGAGMSPFHFHRVFKEVTGLTPKAFASANRGKRMRERLTGKDATITDAIYDAGFSSNSRFYEASNELLGMRPKDYKAGGANAVIRFAVGESSLGAILVAQSERGICAILLGDDPHKLVHDLQDQFPRAELLGGDKSFERLVAQVVGFVEAPQLGLNLPLDVRGTVFQERVWQALRDIPAGSTASYAEIALRIGQPKATRAVAQACGANRLAVAIPCHRVVRSDGDVSGYRWGVSRKRELLNREQALPKTEPVPRAR